ncbi:hypothetical protein [Desulfosporosinus meridiei]|uniref:Uncharacterized protein n=1 Tax=Desulfosporosinus meridiei (strain ATCC BAA-275 / DSM 13257 / KCTC 12902 / NCIMB 13706 / S10) TaxID=768704 RepID=J7IRQ3_DESMD|nr:hypothetical protein [Desulfosporosinus meridiei]AFQ42864.1 hypothetical protein Desmer_0832 [Desulfosporosinus meridiei DSM 13257]
MGNPCGTTNAKIYMTMEVKGVPIYCGSGVNPVNSPAQHFVAWGKGVISSGLIHTFNIESLEQGILWFVDEEEAEAQYAKLQEVLSKR